MIFLAARLHERRTRLSLIGCALVAFIETAFPGTSVAQVVSPCTAQATAPPAITETVTCSRGAISQFFLNAPAMTSIAADQRAEVTSHPLRYAFAYMGADAVNRLQQGFTNPAVKQIDYKAVLTTKGATQPHKIFEVRMDRALAQKTNWATLEPNQLFKLAPTHLSHWLQTQIKAENAKSEPAPLPIHKAPAATNPPVPAGPSPSATGANTGKLPVAR